MHPAVANVLGMEPSHREMAKNLEVQLVARLAEEDQHIGNTIVSGDFEGRDLTDARLVAVVLEKECGLYPLIQSTDGGYVLRVAFLPWVKG